MEELQEVIPQRIPRDAVVRRRLNLLQDLQRQINAAINNQLPGADQAQVETFVLVRMLKPEGWRNPLLNWSVQPGFFETVRSGC